MLKNLILATSLTAFMAGVAAADSTYRSLGVSIHLGTNWNRIQQVQLGMNGAGFSTFRDEVFWHRLETNPGVLNFPSSLADLDKLINESSTSKVKPLIILDYGNKYYDGGDLVHSETGRLAYVNYAKYVVNRYKNHVKKYEVWNEWNIGMGSPLKPRTLGSAEKYTQLLKPTYQAIKSIDSNIQVIGGVVAGLDTKWIDAFIGSEGLKYLDGFSVHPYVHQGSKDQLPETAITWLDSLNQKVQSAAGGRTIPIYVTEIGWPTSVVAPGISEELAAAYFARFQLLAAARTYLAGVWWYTLIDSGNDATNKEHRFGLLRQDLTPKPAYLVAQKLTPVLKTAQVTERVLKQKDTRAVLVNQGVKESLYVWSSGGLVDVDLTDLLQQAGLDSAGVNSATQLTLGTLPLELRRTDGTWSVFPLLSKN